MEEHQLEEWMEGERKKEQEVRRGGGRERYVEWTLSPWGADHPAAANKGRPDLGVFGCWMRAPRLAGMRLPPFSCPRKPHHRHGNVNHSPSSRAFLSGQGKNHGTP